MVVDSADGERLRPIFACDAAHEWPQTLLERCCDELASALRAEDTMKQGVDECMRHGTSLQPSLRDESRLICPLPQR